MTYSRIIGLDLALTATGLACDDGRCATIGRAGITGLPMAARAVAMKVLVHRIVLWADPASGTLVVVESLDARAGHGNGGLSERSFLWWSVVLTAFDMGAQVAEVHPARLKQYATGSGRAAKGAVLSAVRNWQHWEVSRDHNRADAAVLCAIGCHADGRPVVPTGDLRDGIALALPVGDVR